MSQTSIGHAGEQGGGEKEDNVTTSSIPYSRRLHRIDQIEQLQGVWWTCNKEEQLVEIKSSYATFDAPQDIPQAAEKIASSYPAIVYPLGGSDDIVTLRSLKLVQLSPVPQWSSSPTSSTRSATTTSWKKCTNPKKYWKTNIKKSILGYEHSLINLLLGGRHWSSSPVDVVRACIIGCQKNDEYFRENQNVLLALCRSYETLSRHFSSSSGSVSTSWSIVKSQFYSQDVCVIGVQMSNGTYLDFCLTREKNASARGGDEKNQFVSEEVKSTKLPPSMLFNSMMDVELCVSGKSWIIDHVHEVPCPIL